MSASARTRRSAGRSIIPPGRSTRKSRRSKPHNGLALYRLQTQAVCFFWINVPLPLFPVLFSPDRNAPFPLSKWSKPENACKYGVFAKKLQRRSRVEISVAEWKETVIIIQCYPLPKVTSHTVVPSCVSCVAQLQASSPGFYLSLL